ncbi:phosphoserine phosphatase SerB, partial [Salmonella enterica subsp. enterica]|nr:phosphoserine phosphatase SerB [Salmonella enterica subsp. enterica]
MREIILISFLGPDQPNQFTRLMQVLSAHSLQILDVGQAVIHNQLTLGIVVASEDQTATALAMKEILILAHDIGLTVRFKPISATEYDQWVKEGGRTRYIVTALAPELNASHLQAVTQIVSGQGFNIETVTRLSGRPILD